MSEEFNNTPLVLLPPVRVSHVVQTMAEVTDYNHQLLNVPEMWKVTRGAGIKVVVLDTGWPNHVDMTPAGKYSAIPGYGEDTNAHATHVGGLIAANVNGMGVRGIAPEAEDYYGAVLNHSGVGTVNQIIAGIRWAVDVVKADIVNMSLSIPARVGDIKALKDICQYAYEQGTILIAAAGNESGSIGQPARYSTVISVAAVNDKREHANFSNTGPELDFAAGGVNVYSCHLNNLYAQMSGTSMASPALAGLCCLIASAFKQDNGRRITFQELYKSLQEMATDAGPEGWDKTFGHGIPVYSKPAPAPVPDPTPAPIPVPSPPVGPIPPPRSTPPPSLGDCRRLFGAARAFVHAVDVSLNEGATEGAALEQGVARAATYLTRTKQD